MPDLATVPLLLVEDNEQDALALQTALRRLNCSNPIFAVHNAGRAIEYLQGRGAYANRNEFPLPYVVLLDSKATEVFRFIRETPSLSHLFVVALLSKDAKRAATIALELGADSYVMNARDDGELSEFLNLLGKHWSVLDRIIEFRHKAAVGELLRH